MTTAAETSAATREERLEEQLKGLPAKPGVYLFRDARDRVLELRGREQTVGAWVRPLGVAATTVA